MIARIITAMTASHLIHACRSFKCCYSFRNAGLGCQPTAKEFCWPRGASVASFMSLYALGGALPVPRTLCHAVDNPQCRDMGQNSFIHGFKTSPHSSSSALLALSLQPGSNQTKGGTLTRLIQANHSQPKEP